MYEKFVVEIVRMTSEKHTRERVSSRSLKKKIMTSSKSISLNSKKYQRPEVGSMKILRYHRWHIFVKGMQKQMMS